MTEQTYTPIADRQREIVDNFAILGDCEEKYRLIIDMGRKLPPFPEELGKDPINFSLTVTASGS